MSKKYNIFISHSWAYSDAYDRLIELLSKDENFEFKNYSVPKDDPVHTNGTDKELYAAIKNKIQPTNIVIILAGVYSSYSKWIDKEIKISKDEFSVSKPILAVEPWGSEKTSRKVKENANRVVKWNTVSIVSAIRELCK
ncbi:TIR domain-containing protein [Clostridium felsineum]|uniref:Thoeris protein ThsB TIR-like domain-containing protein n=1 Tax=Clostridium felsineum TaxID=36839 RepID=A0A1S8L6W4_9CLOT|nr:TIR domain-containing protein [Clostridium felsineum]URZ04711.1 hypothetical protein CLROS_000200 [Clostridium felsineum]URZ09684.1 hypothetical protein CROST_003770 [Clostridium felsineum]